MFYFISTLGFLFVFSLLVLFHEFGHFLAAKRSKVKVDDFAFGFKPRIWSKVIGETRYAINLLPLGGYVNLHGMDDEAKDKRSYNAQRVRTKLKILLSGVAMNLVLAYLIMFGVYLFGFQPLLPSMTKHAGVKNDLGVVITNVEKETPAEKKGIKSGDIIRKIEGEDVLLQEQVANIIQQKTSSAEGEPTKVNMTVERNGQMITEEISTYKDKVKNDDGEEFEINRIGIELETRGEIRASLPVAMVAAAQDVIEITKMTVMSVIDLFSNLLLRLQVSQQVGGPVALFMVTGGAAHMGFTYLLQVTAFLSIAVGVFNILPIPGLDGGHAFILGLETILRRKFSAKTKNVVQFVGFAGLILLVVIITFKDLFMFGIIN